MATVNTEKQYKTVLSYPIQVPNLGPGPGGRSVGHKKLYKVFRLLKISNDTYSNHPNYNQHERVNSNKCREVKVNLHL